MGEGAEYLAIRFARRAGIEWQAFLDAEIRRGELAGSRMGLLPFLSTPLVRKKAATVFVSIGSLGLTTCTSWPRWGKPLRVAWSHESPSVGRHRARGALGAKPRSAPSQIRMYTTLSTSSM